MERLTIGEVAKQAHVRIGTLRYYERTGLVASPPRSASNYRLYPQETVRRVQFIKRAQELGFSLKEIMELLALRATPETPCADIRQRALDKITTIEEKIQTLNAIKHALAKLVAECSGQGEITDCSILAALATEEKVHNGKGTTMATKRTIEIFSAGCPACEETVTLVNRIACPSCDVTVLDMHNPEVARRAKSFRDSQRACCCD
jgi:MerR family transcriptional regulator, copper efflux regulator